MFHEMDGGSCWGEKEESDGMQNQKAAGERSIDLPVKVKAKKSSDETFVLLFQWNPGSWTLPCFLVDSFVECERLSAEWRMTRFNCD